MAFVLVTLGYGGLAHCQPMLSYYVIELPNDFRLVHSSKDAVMVIHDGRERLMVDPVWDKARVDAYCDLPTLLLVRTQCASASNSEAQAWPRYLVVHKSDDTTESPINGEQLTGALTAARMDVKDVSWTPLAEPNPGAKFILSAFLYGTILVLVAGYVLPIPFLAVAVHTVILRRRLRRLLEHQVETVS